MTDAAAPRELVARDAELADLQRRLRQVGETGPELVLVSGPRGAGTTALVRRLLADHRAAGGRALAAEGVPWEQESPFGVVAQLLGVASPPTDPGAAVDQVVAALAPDDDRAALVVVDDAGHADPESLRTLWSLTHRRPETRVLVVLAATTPVTSAAAEVLDRVHDRVRLEPLDTEAVHRLAGASGVTLHPTMAERLQRFTGGLPGPLLALLAEQPPTRWADVDAALPPPAALGDDVVRRLRSLSDDASALAEAVAVLGRAPVALVSALADVREPLAPLDELAEAGLLRWVELPGAASVEPPDPMTAEAVLVATGRRRRAELHRLAADLVDDPVARLEHLVSASAVPDAALADEVDAVAGERARTGEWGTVARLLTDAARLTAERGPREDRLSRAFDALVGSGDVQRAVASVAEVESLRETPLRNAALAHLAIVRGRAVEAESRLARAWDLVNVERDPATAALICHRRVLHSLARCRGTDLVTWADRAVELGAPGSPAVVESAAIRGVGIAASRRDGEVLTDYAALADQVGHGAQGQRVALGRGWTALTLGEVDVARASLTSAAATDFLGGSTRIALWAHGWLARAHFVTGEWDDALRTADRGMRLARETGMRLVEPLLAWTRAQVHGLRGDWSAADRALRDAMTGPGDHEIMRVAGGLAAASVAEARADYAAVLRALEPLRQPWAADGGDGTGAWPWADMHANALVLEGRHEEADHFLRWHEGRALERQDLTAQARLGVARVRLLGAAGRLDDARAAFDEASNVLEELPLPYDRARVHFGWGQTLRRAGKRREADPVLRTARELYVRLGATTYVERCDRELRAGGVHAGRAAATRDAAALTPQEELVAELVAQGRSNKEVGAELFLSTKTVQYHLTHVYAKLGVRTRGELAALRASTPEA